MPDTHHIGRNKKEEIKKTNKSVCNEHVCKRLFKITETSGLKYFAAQNLIMKI